MIDNSYVLFHKIVCLVVHKVLTERRLMAFLVKYVLIILLRVDIQGILMLWKEENGGGIQVTISLGTRLLKSQKGKVC